MFVHVRARIRPNSVHGLSRKFLQAGENRACYVTCVLLSVSRVAALRSSSCSATLEADIIAVEESRCQKTTQKDRRERKYERMRSHNRSAHPGIITVLSVQEHANNGTTCTVKRFLVPFLGLQ